MSTNNRSFKEYGAGGNEITELQQKLNNPKDYFVSNELRNAVNVALILGQPLLITGEPGTGKTQLAQRVAYERELPTKLFPLTFYTKSISTAKDLFYQYDALRHFHDVQIQNSEPHSEPKSIAAGPYITYGALGQAVLLTMDPHDEPRSRVNKYLPPALQSMGPVRPVVLIDEIDKAPRDLPNDILNELENMSFTVNEIIENKSWMNFKANSDYRPIIIITSNSEKDLPDAFLRRCIFVHLEFPNRATLNKIVEDRLKLQGLTNEARDEFIRLFIKFRELNLNKAPATAELLYWMRVLERGKINLRDKSQHVQLRETYYALAKNPEDLRKIHDETDRLIHDVLKESIEDTPPSSPANQMFR
jgi:MoxR-like ATPase